MLRRICFCRGKQTFSFWGPYNQRSCTLRRTEIAQAYWRINLNLNNRSASHLTLAVASERRLEQLQEELEVRPDILQELAQRGFNLDYIRKGDFRTICPKCQGGSSREISAACKLENNSFVWYCHRAKCGDRGRLPSKGQAPVYEKPKVAFQQLDTHWQGFFQGRGISRSTLHRNQIAQKTGTGDLAFPYFREGEVICVKYRLKREKAFYQSKNSQKILYGWDDIIRQSEVIVVEGELDKLSMEEAGFLNVASIPEGAPARVQPGPLPNPAEDTKFNFLWNSLEALEGAQRILLAVDTDEPGKALAEELARRLGPGICWLVSWTISRESPFLPRQNPATPASVNAAVQPRVYKDANEVLMAEGPEALGACVAAARPFPVPGLQDVGSLTADILRDPATLPPPTGLLLGWDRFDELYAVKPGVITVIKGPAFSGKTEFATCLLQRLARPNFPAGVCLLDGQGAHGTVSRLVEKHVGRPLPEIRKSGGLLQDSLDMIRSQVAIITPTEPLSASQDHILNLVRIAAKRYNLRGVLLDSFQGFNPCPTSAQEVATFVKQIRDFAQQHALHVWVISHTSNNRLEWRDLLTNWADITVNLRRSSKGVQADIHSNDLQSARPGTVYFRFDPATGRFEEVPKW